MEFSFILLILFTFLTIILVTTLFSNNDTTASASSSGSAASKADHSGEEGSLAQSVREEVKAGLVKTGPSVNLTEQQGTVAGLTSTNKPEEDSQRRFVGKITDPVAADRRTVGEEGLHAAEVRIHDATNEGNMKSGIMCWTSNPASAAVDIQGRDFGHLQFPEGWSLLCPFSHQQTGGATESPEDSNCEYGRSGRRTCAHEIRPPDQPDEEDDNQRGAGGGTEGATGAAGSHLPAAEGEPGDVWGGVRGRRGGATQTLLHLNP
ncbi:uncharacterized protein LOC121547712 isoform X3 [Coregonus clupeaformis]|uniref:uncharacterized protein LOC121547712 isoform X3 n=1 Tax=Coregonus clupeaformis TaxID=59861 RepID=UPI001BE08A7A|nr:uncharacterized protein LOC121547712 isoform X3 [Coregonus clupeaformis]